MWRGLVSLPPRPPHDRSAASWRLVDRSARVTSDLVCVRCGLLLALVGLSTLSWAAEPAVTMSISDRQEIVYRWGDHRCGDNLIPDAPARSFRDGHGLVHLIAPHYTNWEMVGPSLNQVQTRCDIIFQGSESGDIARFDDRAWIESTYTLDGTTVYALLSNEWNGGRYADAGCSSTSEQTLRCVYYSITLAISRDAGKAYQYPARHHNVVASVPYRFVEDQGSKQAWGFPTATNIIEREGYYYVLIGSQGRGDQAYGNCLLRTDNLEDPGAWRAWDGHGFVIRFVNPYRGAEYTASEHVCQPVGLGGLNWAVRSISWNAPSRSYIAIFQGASYDASGRRVIGVHYATSSDLISWSAHELLLEAPSTLDHTRCQPFMRYPSMLDPDSPSRNFETVSDHAYIYYTMTNVPDCRQTMDRDLVRLPVSIQPR